MRVYLFHAQIYPNDSIEIGKTPTLGKVIRTGPATVGFVIDHVLGYRYVFVDPNAQTTLRRRKGYGCRKNSGYSCHAHLQFNHRIFVLRSRACQDIVSNVSRWTSQNGTLPLAHVPATMS